MDNSTPEVATEEVPREAGAPGVSADTAASPEAQEGSREDVERAKAVPGEATSASSLLLDFRSVHAQRYAERLAKEAEEQERLRRQREEKVRLLEDRVCGSFVSVQFKASLTFRKSRDIAIRRETAYLRKDCNAKKRNDNKWFLQLWRSVCVSLKTQATLQQMRQSGATQTSMKTKSEFPDNSPPAPSQREGTLTCKALSLFTR